MIIKFDDDEVAALMQRFTVPECIAEALTDHADDEKPVVAVPAQYVEDRAIALARELTEHRQLVIITDVDKEIVKDAIEGSTLPGIINDLYNEGEYTKKEANRRMKTLEKLEIKLRGHGIDTTGFAFIGLIGE